MKVLYIVTILIAICLGCSIKPKQLNNNLSHTICAYKNSYIHNPEYISQTNNNTIDKWDNPQQIVSFFFWVNKIGTVDIWLITKNALNSKIKASIDQTHNIKTLTQDTTHLGHFNVENKGYIELKLKGLTKQSNIYAEPVALITKGPIINEQTKYVKTIPSYWGRKGANVNLHYLTNHADVIAAHCQISIAENSDIPGATFFAIKSYDATLGLNVLPNGDKSIVFNVNNNGENITLIDKYTETTIKRSLKTNKIYGNSELLYNWRVNTPYCFLLETNPNSDGTTTYSAYFNTENNRKWKLIASFLKNKTTTYINNFTSSLQNSLPNNGHKQRVAIFDNQYVIYSNNDKQYINQAILTSDETGKSNSRLDYDAYLSNDKKKFILKHCGFFSNIKTKYKTVLTKEDN